MPTLKNCTGMISHLNVSQTTKCPGQLSAQLVQLLRAAPDQDLQWSCVVHLAVPAGLLSEACFDPLVLL